jgi:serine/threonine protein kinase
LPRRLDLFDQMCAALSYAHRAGWIHRDLKPANVMLDAEDGLVKVLDFGLARQVDTGLTVMPVVLGSPGYMSPEQAEGLALDARTDVFSAAAILYELLTFRKAFPADSPVAAIQQALAGVPEPPTSIDRLLPPPLDEVVLRGLARLRDDRFQTMDAFRRAVRSGPVAALLREVEQCAWDTTVVKPIDAGVSTFERPRAFDLRRTLQGAALVALLAPLAFGAGARGAVSRTSSDVAQPPNPPSDKGLASPSSRNEGHPPAAANQVSEKTNPRAPHTPARVPIVRIEPPPSPAVVESALDLDSAEAVRETLRQYSGAYSHLDAALAASLVASDARDSFAVSFARYQQFELVIEPMDIRISGETAAATCRETRRFTTSSGLVQEPLPETVTYELARDNGRWLIVRTLR